MSHRLEIGKHQTKRKLHKVVSACDCPFEKYSDDRLLCFKNGFSFSIAQLIDLSVAMSELKIKKQISEKNKSAR